MEWKTLKVAKATNGFVLDLDGTISVATAEQLQDVVKGLFAAPGTGAPAALRKPSPRVTDALVARVAAESKNSGVVRTTDLVARWALSAEQALNVAARLVADGRWVATADGWAAPTTVAEEPPAPEPEPDPPPPSDADDEVPAEAGLPF